MLDKLAGSRQTLGPVRICVECLDRFEESGLNRCPKDRAPVLPLGGGDDRIGTVAADRYLILEVLGSGGMGRVYHAYQRVMGRPVALKLLVGDDAKDPEFVERFQREARATAQLRSPHTVVVYDAGRLDSGELYLAMELILGTSLEAVIASEAPLDPSRVALFLEQIADSLDEAHALGLVHRDIKPSNVMVSRSAVGPESLKLLDFGLVKSLLVDEAAKTLTRSDSHYGTPPYMAPEMWSEAAGTVGPWTDIYALGVVLFQMLTGQRPFNPSTLPGFIDAHLHASPPRLFRDGLDPRLAALEPVVMRAMAKRPEARFSSVGALAVEFRGALVSAGDASGPVIGGMNPSLNASADHALSATLRRTEPPAARRGVVGVALFVVALAGAGYALSQVRRPPEPAAEASESLLESPTPTPSPSPERSAPTGPVVPRIRGLKVVGAADASAAARRLRALEPSLVACLREAGAAELRVYLVILPEGRVSSVQAAPATDPAARRFTECVERLELGPFPSFEGSMFATLSFTITA